MLRSGAAVLGLAAFGGGATALFETDNGAGSLFLLGLGTLLVLLAGVGDRIQLESFELLGAKVKVREIVRRRLDLADAAGSAGEQGVLMRRQALTLQRLAGLYQLYEHVRAVEPVSDRRTATLDQLAVEMRASAREVEFDPAEVSVWFHEGSDVLRVVALNVMLARVECRDFAAVIKATDEPRTLFEQYYALMLARAMLPGLDRLEQRLLSQAIERARSRRRFRRDVPLMALSDSILAALGD